MYYFGNMDKSTIMDFEKSSFRDVYSGYTLNLHSFGGKFGVQYEQSLNNGLYMTFGATYKTSSKLHGYVTDYKYATISSVSDTLHHSIDTLSHGKATKLASEYGVGVSLRKGDKWRIEFDYLRSDWTKSNLENATGFPMWVNPSSPRLFTVLQGRIRDCSEQKRYPLLYEKVFL